MTYRDRRLARAERLRDYADKNDAKSTAAHEGARKIMDGIPLGQPILVGHHSEKRARADVRRIDSGMRTAHELGSRAGEQRSRADEIERQAENAIYSDDADAVERLEQKIADLEAERERRKKANADYRREHRAELKTMTAYEKSQAVPYPAYSISNIGGQISQGRKRLEHLRYAAKQRAGEAPVRYRTISARYAGSCDECGAKVERGDTIGYARNAPDGRNVLCGTCTP
jgi:hypothetical protein